MKAKCLLDVELRGVLKHIYTSRISGSLGRRVLDVVKSYDAASASFEEAKASLQKEFGVKGEDGQVSYKDGHVVLQEDKADEFHKEYNSLLDQDFAVKKLSIDDLEDIPSISAREIQLLSEAGFIRALN